MKNMITLGILTAIILVGQSFTAKAPKPAADKAAPAFAFFIDGAPFDAAPTDNYTAQLINGGKTVSLTFIGNSLKTKSGEVYPTKLTIDYAAKEDALGEVNVEKITYDYNNVKYNGLAGTAFVSLTKVKRSADGKSLLLSADIFCKVQKSYIMEEFVPVFTITGGVQNIKLNMPAM